MLISEPNSQDAIHLPYIWAILKTYWEHHGSSPEAFDWLPPAFLRDRVEYHLDEDYPDPPDVVGLSCYTWNFALNCRVAAWAKRRNPDCIVVAGGPDPDYKDCDFFRKYPQIDAVVVKDGEIPFTRILEAVLAGSRDVRHIGGIYLPNQDAECAQSSSPHLFTGPTDVPEVFDVSPYIAQEKHYEGILDRLDGQWYFATWETNRGCPFRCNYCDWGSATMAKVRRFDDSRIAAEAEWFGRMKVPALFLADANVGMLPRDVQIVEHLVKVKQQYGNPRRIWYSSAKNSPTRVFEVARRLHAAGLTTEHTLSVQHTDLEVLKNADRANISVPAMQELVGKLREVGIPCEVQLIAGIPGDSPEKWRRAVTDVMEWGVHENYYTFAYNLLPNAPAAEQAYREKWQLQTVTRRMSREGGVRDASQPRQMEAVILVGTTSYSPADWVDMMTFSSFARALHNRGLTRWPALYLRQVHNIDYRTFYGHLIDGILRESPRLGWIQKRVREQYTSVVADPNGTDEMELEDFPDLNFAFDPCKWAYIQICRQFNVFLDEVTDGLVARFPQATALRSVIDYQGNMVALPNYDSRQGRTFAIEHDWPAFIRQCGDMKAFGAIAEPDRLAVPTVATIPVAQRNGDGDQFVYAAASVETRWREWIKKTCMNANVLRATNLPCPVVETACPPVPSPATSTTMAWRRDDSARNDRVNRLWRALRSFVSR